MAIFFTPKFLTGLSSTTKRVLYFGAVLFALFTVGSFLLGSVALSVLGTIFGGPVLIGLVVISSPLLLVFSVAAVNVALLSLGTFFGVKFLLKRCRRDSRGSLEESDEEIIISEIPSPQDGKCQEAEAAEDEAVKQEADEAFQLETDEAVQQNVDDDAQPEKPDEVLEEAAEDTKGAEEKPEEKVNDEEGSGSAEEETMPMVSPEPQEPPAWTSPEGTLNALSPESQQTELFTSSGEQQFTSAESMEELNSETKEEDLTSGTSKARANSEDKAENRSASSSQQSTDTEAGKANGSRNRNAKSSKGSKSSRSATPPEGSHSLKHPDTPVPAGKHAQKKNRKKNKQQQKHQHSQAQRKDHQNA